jgi:hypothetical protein
LADFVNLKGGGWSQSGLMTAERKGGERHDSLLLPFIHYNAQQLKIFFLIGLGLFLQELQATQFFFFFCALDQSSMLAPDYYNTRVSGVWLWHAV